MCLTLTSNRLKTAKEDIVVYKRLKVNFDFGDAIDELEGKSFTGQIRGIECEGKIHVEQNHIYFYTDLQGLDGNRADDTLGYKYSWAYDDAVVKVNIEGCDIHTEYKTPYQCAIVEIGKTYESELIKIEDDNDTNIYIVEVGLHSYDCIERMGDTMYNIVVKCIIPKGAKYYSGYFNGCPSYASDALKYIEVL